MHQEARRFARRHIHAMPRSALRGAAAVRARRFARLTRFTTQTRQGGNPAVRSPEPADATEPARKAHGARPARTVRSAGFGVADPVAGRASLVDSRALGLRTIVASRRRAPPRRIGQGHCVPAHPAL